MVPSTARPSAPPTWRVVFNRPLARPPWSEAAPEVAATVIGANISPPPVIARHAGTITSARSVSTVRPPSQAIPAAATRPPVPNSSRASTREMSQKLICEPAMTARETGTKMPPASIGA